MSLSLVAEAVATPLRVDSQVVAVVLAVIVRRLAENLLVVVVQPNHLWRSQAV
jgi:hypothetical protein